MPAARKETIEPINLGLSAEDVKLPRMSVLGKLSKLPDHMPEARSGMIAIGLGAEDTESQLFDAMNGKEPVRAYVLDVYVNYACSFKDKDANPDLAGQWDEDDESRPPQAQRQYNYTMFVPQHSDILPVVYTASSSAAGAAKGMNSKLSTAAMAGQDTYTMCFEISTVIKTSGSYSYPGPVFVLGEPKPEEVTAAQQMRDAMFGPRNAQLAASNGDKPAL